MDYGVVRPTYFRPSPAALCVLGLTLLLLSTGCEEEQAPERRQIDDAPVRIDHSLDALEALPLRDLRELNPQKLRRLRSEDAELYPSCREIFEEEGRFLNWPLSEKERPAALFGCDPEAYLELDDGRRAVAYARAMQDHNRASHLQIVFYDPDGQVLWHRLMDRSREAENFSANYRGSFLTPVSEHAFCAGTLWQGATQMLCVRPDTGEVVYDGRMDFWAGVKPFGFDGSLFSTDLRGITRRYPFTGMEMRHRRMEGRGGRAAFYATDEARIFFAPADEETFISGWDLASLRNIWTLELPARPRITYAHVSPEHRLLLFKVRDVIYGVDTITGAPRMALKVGEAHPPVTFSDDAIYLLLRRPNDPPVVYALAPEDGEIQWKSLAASGTLQVHYDEGLMLRTVRAVRRVSLVE